MRKLVLSGFDPYISLIASSSARAVRSIATSRRAECELAVIWANYFQEVPSGGSFRLFTLSGHDPHFLPYAVFLAQVTGVPGAPALPQVSFVDPDFGFFSRNAENDEHPPADIQRGQAFLSQLVNAVRNGPYWKDSIILITYDEHGGFYDHVKPPQSSQGGTRTPDGIAPPRSFDTIALPPVGTRI